MIRALFSLAWQLLLVLPLGADTLSQQQGSATLQVTADRIEQGQVQLPLSGRLTLTITLEGKAPLEVEEESRIEAPLVWQVQASKPELTDLLGGRQRWQLVLHVEPLKTGEPILQLTPLHYREAGSELKKITWKDIPVKVTTRVLRPALTEMRDIPPIEPPPPPPERPSWRAPLLYFLATLAVLLAVAWIIHRLRGKPQPLPAHVLALRELKQLEQATGVQLATRLSEILRAYIERRFTIPALCQTTAETCAALQKDSIVTAEQLARLQEMLQRCDEARFAPAGPVASTPEVSGRLRNPAHQVVASTPPASPGASAPKDEHTLIRQVWEWIEGTKSTEKETSS